MKIAAVTTCKGRLEHIRATLPKNLRHSGSNVVQILLDYNDKDGLGDYIQQVHQDDIDSGKLVYYHHRDAPRFHMAHAKNMAHRCAMREGADILVTLDADNLTGPGFTGYVTEQFQIDPELSFLAPDFEALPPRGQRFDPKHPLRLARGFYGRLAIRTQAFVKAGGYNEVYSMWGSEDCDILARLHRLNSKKRSIPPIFLNAIAHSSDVRFKEYPEARKFENDEIMAVTAKAHDTVVNNGNIGCGTVFRNFGNEAIDIGPIPTRIFGIGMQRTGTTSLHEAFRTLGYDAAHWKSAEWAQMIWREINRWGRSRTLEQEYALCDNPIPILYKELDKAYPGSKFVLTVRNEDDWIKSVATFWTYEGNRHRWTWDEDGFSHKMHGIIYGTTEFDEQIFRERYRKHNHDVMKYFHGRSDLGKLEIEKATSISGLCRFLGAPIVNKPFPHANRGPM